MLRLVLWTIALEGIALLSFIFVARSDWAETGKPIAVAFGFCAALFLVVAAGTTMSPRRLVDYSAVVAIGDVLLFDLLAFGRFGGMVKDTPFLSVDHVARMAVIAGLLFVGHLLGTSTVWGIRRALASKPT
jgi:hypothetical protein